MARNVSDHRFIDMEVELIWHDALLLRDEPRMDNMAGRQSPASDRHSGRDSDSRHNNDESGTSMASSVVSTSTMNRIVSGVQVSGKARHVRTLQTGIAHRVLPRYTNSETCANDMHAIYVELVICVIREGFN